MITTLSGVIAEVDRLMLAVADSTTIKVGKQYLERGAGSPARVVFVPDQDGDWGAPMKFSAGHAASVTHGCTMYVRAAEGTDDTKRFDNATALGDKLINALRRAAPGRIQGKKISDGSPVAVDAYGAELVFAFTYQRDVQKDETLWKVPSQNDTLTPIRPDEPNGPTGKSYTVTTTVTPEARP